MVEKISKLCFKHFRFIVLGFGLVLVIAAVIIALFITLPAFSEFGKVEKDQKFNTTETEELETSNFTVKAYTIETQDGYILQMQRVLPRNESYHSSKGTVFLMHDIGCESSIFIDDGSTSLAYLIADAGFDVWLGNARGNRYGLRHKTLTINSSTFWNFALDEIAAYDIPAQLSHVLKITNSKEVFYVGQSFGNTLGMMLLSTSSEWNEKIKAVLGIQPVTRLTYTTWPYIRCYSWIYKWIASFVNVLEMFSFQPALNEYAPSSSGVSGSDFDVEGDEWAYSNGLNYDRILLGLSWPGYNPLTLSTAKDKVYLKHCSSGTSLKAIIHTLQATITQQLFRYSYGFFSNSAKYNSASPPFYDFSKISVPVALFTSENDPLANPLDVSHLMKDLPNVYAHFVHPLVMYSHFETQQEFNIVMREKVVEVLLEMVK